MIPKDFVVPKRLLVLVLMCGVALFLASHSRAKSPLLYLFCPILLGFLASDKERKMSGVAGILPASSRMQELVIKSPRLWDEIERLILNERIKVATNLRERIGSSAYAQALAGMEVCRECFLRNETGSVVQVIADIKDCISAGISEVRKCINQLKVDSLSPKELALISNIAGKVGGDTKVPRFRSEVKKLILSERDRIARDLHDEVIQNLATVLIGLQVCERLLTQDAARAARKLRDLEELTIETDRIIYDLSFCHKFDDKNGCKLVEELKVYVKTFEGISNIPVDVRVRGKENDIPVEVRTNLIQIIKEALANAAKHAEASRVGIRLTFRFDRVITQVSDNGKGFNLSTEVRRDERTGHLGLLGMQERAKVLGGNLVIDTEPGNGSRVFVEIPIH